MHAWKYSRTYHHQKGRPPCPPYDSSWPTDPSDAQFNAWNLIADGSCWKKARRQGERKKLLNEKKSVRWRELSRRTGELKDVPSLASYNLKCSRSPVFIPTLASPLHFASALAASTASLMPARFTTARPLCGGAARREMGTETLPPDICRYDDNTENFTWEESYAAQSNPVEWSGEPERSLQSQFDESDERNLNTGTEAEHTAARSKGPLIPQPPSEPPPRAVHRSESGARSYIGANRQLSMGKMAAVADSESRSTPETSGRSDPGFRAGPSWPTEADTNELPSTHVASQTILGIQRCTITHVLPNVKQAPPLQVHTGGGGRPSPRRGGPPYSPAPPPGPSHQPAPSPSQPISTPTPPPRPRRISLPGQGTPPVRHFRSSSPGKASELGPLSPATPTAAPISSSATAADGDGTTSDPPSTTGTAADAGTPPLRHFRSSSPGKASQLGPHSPATLMAAPIFSSATAADAGTTPDPPSAEGTDADAGTPPVTTATAPAGGGTTSQPPSATATAPAGGGTTSQPPSATANASNGDGTLSDPFSSPATACAADGTTSHPPSTTATASDGDGTTSHPPSTTATAGAGNGTTSVGPTTPTSTTTIISSTTSPAAAEDGTSTTVGPKTLTSTTTAGSSTTSPAAAENGTNTTVSPTTPARSTTTAGTSTTAPAAAEDSNSTTVGPRFHAETLTRGWIAGEWAVQGSGMPKSDAGGNTPAPGGGEVTLLPPGEGVGEGTLRIPGEEEGTLWNLGKVEGALLPPGKGSSTARGQGSTSTSIELKTSAPPEYLAAATSLYANQESQPKLLKPSAPHPDQESGPELLKPSAMYPDQESPPALDSTSTWFPIQDKETDHQALKPLMIHGRDPLCPDLRNSSVPYADRGSKVGLAQTALSYPNFRVLETSRGGAKKLANYNLEAGMAEATLSHPNLRVVEASRGGANNLALSNLEVDLGADMAEATLSHPNLEVDLEADMAEATLSHPNLRVLETSIGGANSLVCPKLETSIGGANSLVCPKLELETSTREVTNAVHPHSVLGTDTGGLNNPFHPNSEVESSTRGVDTAFHTYSEVGTNAGGPSNPFHPHLDLVAGRGEAMLRLNHRGPLPELRTARRLGYEEPKGEEPRAISFYPDQDAHRGPLSELRTATLLAYQEPSGEEPRVISFYPNQDAHGGPRPELRTASLLAYQEPSGEEPRVMSFYPDQDVHSCPIMKASLRPDQDPELAFTQSLTLYPTEGFDSGERYTPGPAPKQDWVCDTISRGGLRTMLQGSSAASQVPTLPSISGAKPIIVSYPHDELANSSPPKWALPSQHSEPGVPHRARTTRRPSLGCPDPPRTRTLLDPAGPPKWALPSRKSEPAVLRPKSSLGCPQPPGTRSLLDPTGPPNWALPSRNSEPSDLITPRDRARFSSNGAELAWDTGSTQRIPRGGILDQDPSPHQWMVTRRSSAMRRASGVGCTSRGRRASYDGSGPELSTPTAASLVQYLH
eukprot:gene29023-32223_t